MKKDFNKIPDNWCSPVIVNEGYNVHKQEPNVWLIIVFQPMRTSLLILDQPQNSE